METDPRRWITALRTAHEGLVDVVAAVGDDGLTTPSMCREWTVAQVLSHLGSGAEIGRSGLVAATGGPPTIGASGNEAVWARWNAMTPAEMAAAFVAADRALVETYEGLDDEQLTTVRVDLGFLPEPLDLASLAGMRLGEHALHSWDVTAAFDHDSEVEAGACALLIDRLPVMVALIGGFMPRGTRPTPGATITVTTTVPDRSFDLELGDVAALRPSTGARTAGELQIPAGALLRLTAGRLRPGWPAADVAPTGGLTMDELRGAFPGY